MTIYSNEDYTQDAKALKAALDAAGVKGVELSANSERLNIDWLEVVIVTKGGGQYLVSISDRFPERHDLESVLALL